MNPQDYGEQIPLLQVVPPAPMKTKSPMLAFILGVIPGIGQFYCGARMGALLYFAFFIALSFLAPGGAFFFMVGSMVDSAWRARYINLKALII